MDQTPPARYLPWATDEIDPDDPVGSRPWADEDAPEVGREASIDAAKVGPEPDDGIRVLTRAPRTLAEGLRAALAITGMSAGEVAAATGMHRNSIGNYIGGGTRPRIPKADHLWKLAEALAPGLGLQPLELWAEFGRLIRDTVRV